MIEEEPSKEDIFNQAVRLIRAVLWVSALDDTGGRVSQAQERRALIEALRHFMHERDYKPLYQVFETAIENNKAWDQWSRDLSNLTRELQESADAMPLIERQAIYDLSYTIASQFRERGFLSVLLTGFFVSLKNFFLSADDKVDVGEYLNISRVEKSALNEMAEILNLPRKILK